MHIKICGLSTIEHALVAEQAGADLLGFVFAPSKRQISPAQAADIIAKLQPTTKTVGVFVNEDAAIVNAIAQQLGLNYVQLHGNEDERYASQIQTPIIKAFSINDIANNPALIHFPATYLLIDNAVAGTGIAYDYSKLAPLAKQRAIFVAGGITIDNVSQALAIAPVGIDISSGVETNGIKDNIKIQQFITAVRGD